jgi:hypothetical protein
MTPIQKINVWDQDTEWTVRIIGTQRNPSNNKIVIVNKNKPRIRLEIDAPGICSAGESQRRQGREAIQSTLYLLQRGLKSGVVLSGFRVVRR